MDMDESRSVAVPSLPAAETGSGDTGKVEGVRNSDCRCQGAQQEQCAQRLLAQRTRGVGRAHSFTRSGSRSGRSSGRFGDASVGSIGEFTARRGVVCVGKGAKNAEADTASSHSISSEESGADGCVFAAHPSKQHLGFLAIRI